MRAAYMSKISWRKLFVAWLSWLSAISMAVSAAKVQWSCTVVPVTPIECSPGLWTEVGSHLDSSWKAFHWKLKVVSLTQWLRLLYNCMWCMHPGVLSMYRISFIIIIVISVVIKIVALLAVLDKNLFKKYYHAGICICVHANVHT